MVANVNPLLCGEPNDAPAPPNWVVWQYQTVRGGPVIVNVRTTELRGLTSSHLGPPTVYSRRVSTSELVALVQCRVVPCRCSVYYREAWG